MVVDVAFVTLSAILVLAGLWVLWTATVEALRDWRQ